MTKVPHGGREQAAGRGIYGRDGNMGQQWYVVASRGGWLVERTAGGYYLTGSPEAASIYPTERAARQAARAAGNRVEIAARVYPARLSGTGRTLIVTVASECSC